MALRLNAAGSQDFEADLPVALAIASAFRLESLILPKVSTAAELRSAAQQLKTKGLPDHCLLPILETQAALSNAGEITAAAAEIGSGAVVYGHHDYCLDAGLWPFPEPETDAYWLPVETVAEAAQDAGLRHVHPPTSRLRDRRMLGALLTRLASISSEDGTAKSSPHLRGV